MLGANFDQNKANLGQNKANLGQNKANWRCFFPKRELVARSPAGALRRSAALEGAKRLPEALAVQSKKYARTLTSDKTGPNFADTRRNGVSTSPSILGLSIVSPIQDETASVHLQASSVCPLFRRYKTKRNVGSSDDYLR